MSTHTMNMLRKMYPKRYPSRRRKEVTDADFKNTLCDELSGIAIRIRNRIANHPETTLDPKLSDMRSALTLEMLAKDIRSSAAVSPPETHAIHS